MGTTSDAFSGWQKCDPDKDTHNKEVEDATKYMLYTAVPDFAKEYV